MNRLELSPVVIQGFDVGEGVVMFNWSTAHQKLKTQNHLYNKFFSKIIVRGSFLCLILYHTIFYGGMRVANDFADLAIPITLFFQTVIPSLLSVCYFLFSPSDKNWCIYKTRNAGCLVCFCSGDIRNKTLKNTKIKTRTV